VFHSSFLEEGGNLLQSLEMFFLFPLAKLSQTPCPMLVTFVCPLTASLCNAGQDLRWKELQPVQVSSDFSFVPDKSHGAALMESALHPLSLSWGDAFLGQWEAVAGGTSARCVWVDVMWSQKSSNISSSASLFTCLFGKSRCLASWIALDPIDLDRDYMEQDLVWEQKGYYFPLAGWADGSCCSCQGLTLGWGQCQKQVTEDHVSHCC